MTITAHEASSSNSSNSIPKWNFHVFLSFRGEDTRKSFTDHLYAALCSKGIKAFRDDDDLERGEVISQELLQAIERSLFAIVVLSKDYASSSWCLDELEKIIASRKEVGQQVFPIFYGVDPSDVRHQRGSFAQAFIKHAEKFKEDPEKVQKWRDCLTEVANLSGWDSKVWSEVKLIGKVVDALWSKLHSKLPPYDAKLVGIDSKINAIDSLLGIGSDDVRFVGIWGMGGVGKTTLARVVFERLFHKFEISCFLSNVREVSERVDGHIHLQRKILSHLRLKGMIIEDTYEGKKMIQNLCCNRKVLLVLDDVSSSCQLENLAESHRWFGAGSRVIITSRNFHLLKSHGVHEIYKVEILNEEESLQLFSKKAFRRDQPKEHYLALSKSVTKYAAGLPLALQVLGSFLCGRNEPQWEDILDLLKLDLNIDIHKILRISYDGLNAFEKTIFLDIACFFESRVNKDKVTQILKLCGLRPTIGISLLVEKSLLSETVIGGCTYIDMHDLIQEMGKSIVIQESPDDPGKRSRLWSLKDIANILKEKNMGTRVIQGIFLPSNSHESYCNREAFSKMINLRLLKITSNLNLPYGLKCLSSALKVLQWSAYPLEDLPLGTQLDKLAYLQMHHSKIKWLWDERQCFENLRFMDLSHSNYLFKTPTFVGVPNLETLILKDCISLVEVHSSLGQLKNLHVVNLKGCKNLKILPRKLEMDSLKEFLLLGCTQVKKLSEFGENMKNLERLDLQETSIAKLPDSLGLLTSMKVLNLKSCKNLVCLPQTIHNLKHLKNLDISGCSKFSKLPENLNENAALEKLDASETAITKVSSSIGQLEKLKTLSFHRCNGIMSNSSWILPLPLSKIFQRQQFPKGLILPPSIFNLKSLTELDLSYCNIDEGFIPNDLLGLSSLQKLNLRGNKFVNVPASIFNLKSLVELDLSCCNIDEGFIPDDVGCLSLLKRLNLSGNKFANLPASIFNLKSLVDLDLSHCNIDEGFIPNNVDGLSLLQQLNLSGNKFTNLPASICNLTSLVDLNLSYCNIDEGFILDDLNSLSSLWELDLSGNNFLNLPATCFSGLLQLRLLYLDSCPRLQSLPHPPQHLSYLKAYNCASMEPLSNQQLSHLFATFYQSAKDTTFSIDTPGDKIPSWFKNQNNITLDKDGQCSLIIDVPPREWLGYAWCIVLQPKQNNFGLPNCQWFYYESAIGSDDIISVGFANNLSFLSGQKIPCAWIDFVKKKSTESLVECNQLLLKFKAFDSKVEETHSIKYGCRFIHKEDLEEWSKTMSESHYSMLEEDNNGENGMCCEVEKQGQRNLTLIDKCETNSPELSSSCFQDEGKLG